MAEIDKDEHNEKQFLGVLPILLLVASSLLILVLLSIQTTEWYVAEVVDPLGQPTLVEEWDHYGLVGQVNHLSLSGDTKEVPLRYKASLDEMYSYPGVARNMLYLLVGVILCNCWFVYLAIRLEYGLEEGESRWSYFLPSIVGIFTVFTFGMGLLYFYVAFEGALREDMGSAIVWDTAGVGSAFWVALVSLLVMLPAVAISFIGSWRAMDKSLPNG